MTGEKTSNVSISFDMFPSFEVQLEDIYNRQFTGDADVDPIGGRKRRPTVAYRVRERYVMCSLHEHLQVYSGTMR